MPQIKPGHVVQGPCWEQFRPRFAGGQEHAG